MEFDLVDGTAVFACRAAEGVGPPVIHPTSDPKAKLGL